MTQPAITDLRRELEKARLALIDAVSHLSAHAEANAALHCATEVFYSPLHAKVTAAINGIDLALARTQGAVTATALEPAPAHYDGNCPWIGILSDLTRCQHGRHQGDACGPADNCTTWSAGNPHMRPGNVIGYGRHGRHGGDEIVMPDRDHKHDPAAWRQAAPRSEEAGA